MRNHSTTERRPKRRRFVPMSRRREIALDGRPMKNKTSLSMDPEHWRIFDTLCKPFPWQGNRSHWLRDHLLWLGSRQGQEVMERVKAETA